MSEILLVVLLGVIFFFVYSDETVYPGSVATLRLDGLLVAATALMAVVIASTAFLGQNNWLDQRDISMILKQLDEFYSPLVGHFINAPNYYKPAGREISQILRRKSHLRVNGQLNPIFMGGGIRYLEDSDPSEGEEDVMYYEPPGSKLWETFQKNVCDEYTDLMETLRTLSGAKTVQKPVIPPLKPLNVTEST